MVHATPLAAKVAAINTANEYALEVWPKLRAIFSPFVGEKITKIDGTLFKKIIELLPEFSCDPSLHVYRYTSDYSLAWVVKTINCYPNQRGDCHIAVYHETVVYVGHMRNGVLEKFYDAPVLRTDYTVQEIQDKRQALENAKRIVDNCQSALYPFGESDR